jgi:hypothetical protein
MRRLRAHRRPPLTQRRLCALQNVLGIILGGGAGTRLYPLTKKRAKPAVPLVSSPPPGPRAARWRPRRGAGRATRSRARDAAWGARQAAQPASAHALRRP